MFNENKEEFSAALHDMKNTINPLRPVMNMYSLNKNACNIL